jgi:arsenate reductase/ArsR family transcriptional regulator
MTKHSLHEAVLIHKALGHPVRLRILAMLGRGELCVCQMTAVLDLATSTVSAHLADLKRAGLVNERKDGRWVLYRRADEPALSLLAEDMVGRFAEDPQVRSDSRLLAVLRRVPRDELCRADRRLDRLGIERNACESRRPRQRRRPAAGPRDP